MIVQVQVLSRAPELGVPDSLYGGYGVTVNTGVCGTSDSGSIPGSHPNITKTACEGGLTICCVTSGNRKTEWGPIQQDGERVGVAEISERRRGNYL